MNWSKEKEAASDGVFCWFLVQRKQTPQTSFPVLIPWFDLTMQVFALLQIVSGSINLICLYFSGVFCSIKRLELGLLEGGNLGCIALEQHREI